MVKSVFTRKKIPPGFLKRFHWHLSPGSRRRWIKTEILFAFFLLIVFFPRLWALNLVLERLRDSYLIFQWTKLEPNSPENKSVNAIFISFEFITFNSFYRFSKFSWNSGYKIWYEKETQTAYLKLGIVPIFIFMIRLYVRV